MAELGVKGSDPFSVLKCVVINGTFGFILYGRKRKRNYFIRGTIVNTYRDN